MLLLMCVVVHGLKSAEWLARQGIVGPGASAELNALAREARKVGIVRTKKTSRWGDAKEVARVRSQSSWPLARSSARDTKFVSVKAYRLSEVVVASRDFAEEVAAMARKREFQDLESRELGWIERDSLFNSMFDEALSPGEVRVVESAQGFHVVKVEDVLCDMPLKVIRQRKTKSDLTLRDYMRGKTYKITTMGCQMNAADSERLEGSLIDLGLTETDGIADVVVVNTCSIREKAEKKVYSFVGAQPKNATLIVAGCVAQQEGERLARKMPQVDVVMGPQFANRVEEALERAVLWGEQVVATEAARVTEDVTKPKRASEVVAWVNVMHGCNERCTYCVVPATRGVEQSRSPESVLGELRQLKEAGFKEATLLGQNVDAYGRDLPNRVYFHQLLEMAAQQVQKDFRIRFVTSHPRYMSEKVVDVVAKYPDVLMPVFHIPAQSGDDVMLRWMGRGYNVRKYLKIVDRIRSRLPNATITSDFIVGCPGETDAMFQATLDLMRAVRFDSCMTAAYSPRPSTPMARWDGAADAFRDYGVRVEGSTQELRDELRRRFRERAFADPDNLRQHVETRKVATRALDRIDNDPLFAFDPLAEIGPAQLEDDVKEVRLRTINDLANEHALLRSQRYLGNVEQVLVESRNTRRPDQVVGRTRGNKLVFFEGDIRQLQGRFVDVRINNASAFSLTGTALV